VIVGGVTSATADELVIGAAGIFVACASVAAAVLVARFSACMTKPTVDPDATVMLQKVFLFILKLPTAGIVKVSVAVPVFPATVKVVCPHPMVVGVDSVPKENCGSTIATLSWRFRSAVLENAKLRDVAAFVFGVPIWRLVPTNAGRVIAGEFVIA
jgi:hypothetical protein